MRGTPAHRVALHAQGTVGLITATPGLYPLLRGWENLVFFGRLYGLSPDDTRARVHDLAQALDLADALHARTATFSSGMQQKVSLLRALLMAPPVLLLDEPTANLDPLSAHVIHATARAQADAGKGVIWVTHDLAAAERLCDRVALVAGRIAALQTFDSPRAVPPAGRLLDTWRDALGAT